MFKLLAAMFGGPGRRPANRAQARRGLQVRLGLDELSHRIVPSACSSGMAAAGRAAHVSDDGESAGAIVRSASRESGHTCAAQQATLTASLTNESGATGTASVDSEAGTLTVAVQGAAVSSSLEVAIDGTSVGTLSTDASGNANASLTGITTQAGSAITVGDLQGTFVQNRFTASLTGSTEATGNASFDAAKNNLRVVVRDAAASTTYGVSIDGTVVGQLTTNETGSGKLIVSPTTAIQAGSTIAILDAATQSSLFEGLFA